ncbi:BTAD domain-containing putative transcriptional regulator [Lentzea sp. CA-135723]|uniref:BTAD domain-containing putative transcriptional regulator n=1 Tax=Lentzea sp. CA-135723 TaxID=3239950 RepID=UPI003D90A254
MALVALSTLVIGLPWALAHFVGWPLPDHVPTWDEVHATLLNPMSGQFFINLLATVCWISWFGFVLAVVRSIIDLARGMTWTAPRARGPLQALAGTLVGAVVLTLLTNRALAVTSDGRAHDLKPTEVVGPAVPGRASAPASGLVIDRTAPAPPGLVRVVDEVRLPHNGVYDSLWRLAERIHGPGSGHRWPELFQLNRGVEQADGRSLTDPNLLRPGWKIAAYVSEQAEPQPPQQLPRPDSTAPPATPSATATPAPTQQQVDQATPGLEPKVGVFVSVGLAAALSAVLVSTRLRRRRRYRLGSGERSDLQRPVAPAVRALQAAHQNDRSAHGGDIEIVDFGPASSEPQLPVAVGVKQGHEFALSLASTRGIGLAGPGSAAAVRALLLHVLTAQGTLKALSVLLPAQDLHLLFGETEVQDLPMAVRVVSSIDTALDEMETALLSRARCAGGEPTTGLPAVVLVARPAAHAERRLQAVLDNGSTLGLAGILLGPWKPGTTVVVRADGTVSATSPRLGTEFSGARLFTLPSTDAIDLLTVLRDAEAALAPAEDRPHQGRADLEPEPAIPAPCSCAAAVDEIDTPCPHRPRLTVKAFGRFQLVFTPIGAEARDLNELLTPKHREVLVHLALHPQGVRRDVLNEAVWPDSRPPRPYNSFHNAMSMLRRLVTDATDGAMANFVLNDKGRYRLNDELADVDLWEFQRALQEPLHTGNDRTAQLHAAVDLYVGDVAEDLLAPWVEPLRESARRDVLDALAALVREHSLTDPEAALALLERARKLDPYNEGVYRDIMRTQARLGQHTAVPRTLALLTATLGEIDEEPSVDTLTLAELSGRGTAEPLLTARDRAAS